MAVVFAGRRLGAGVRLALVTGLALSLTGCGVEAVVPPLAIAAGVEGAALNQSGKTVSDHLVSWVTGEDCSVLRASDQKDGRYCVSSAQLAQEKEELHRPYLGDCYKTRGGVACYDAPDPTHTSETHVYSAP